MQTTDIGNGQLPATMKALLMTRPHAPLALMDVPVPAPGMHEVLVKVISCGVCRTDLHILDGELTSPKLPLIPGHEIIGRVVKCGPRSGRFQPGTLVGIPWLAYACGTCTWCRRGKENLCENALFTGYTKDGGFAEYTVAFEDFCFELPAAIAQPENAPLLCAGLIGYRSYRMLPETGGPIGIYGFGAAAHILIQVLVQSGKRVFVFTKPQDVAAQDFARSLKASWVGESGASSPEKLAGAIIFAPDGSTIPQALGNLEKGGTVVCGGIHMSDIPSFPYRLLWEERTVKSVANVTRDDGSALFGLPCLPRIHVSGELFQLKFANDAINAFRNGRIRGAAILVP